jgi:hypothetical protein
MNTPHQTATRDRIARIAGKRRPVLVRSHRRGYNRADERLRARVRPPVQLAQAHLGSPRVTRVVPGPFGLRLLRRPGSEGYRVSVTGSPPALRTARGRAREAAARESRRRNR